jgi:hypothetical protein
MRHDLSLRQPLTVRTLPIGVVPPPFPARLVASAGGSNALPPRRPRTRRRAVPIASVTRATEQKFLRASRARPTPQPPHSTAVAAAVDFAGRPCEARSQQLDRPSCGRLTSGSPEPATSGCFLLAGAAAAVFTTTPRSEPKPRCHQDRGGHPLGHPRRQSLQQNSSDKSRATPRSP